MYNDQLLFKQFESKLQQSKEDLKKLGYEEYILDDFYDLIYEKLQLLK